ncbi:copper chaperone CopZ [Lacicoccus alkaliphilus]|uniref:Copper chaperone CopZ n=1 Tax=Lacicoccus alkaliphilus DSM 16010 TaxID=1123231 RepID=A0A1M7IJF2_9BACL|nr:copper chaperone CopZ [Salinicoccus alkaliphilus]SHM40799.1 copper chaperone [Salinicoccus alkaliphilus DSM 16010]
MNTTSIKVEGMTCGHCKSAVEGALGNLSGVEKAEVDLSANAVSVEYAEDKVTVEEMNEAIEEQGYDVVK